MLKALVTGTALVVIAAAGARQGAHAAMAQEDARLFAVRFQPGPGWDQSRAPGAQAGFAAHSANLQRLAREGTIVLGGRFAELGLVVIKSRDLDTARALFADDPAVAAKVFDIRIDTWSTIFDGCVKRGM